MKTLRASEARKEFLPLIRKIAKSSERYALSHRGKVVAVLLSVEDYEELMESLGIISDLEMVEGIKRAEKDIQEGRTYSLEEVFDEGEVRSKSNF